MTALQRVLRPMSVVALALALAPDVGAQTLRGRTLEEWRALIEPRPGELAWTEIPWRASFWEGELEAQREKKPLLLWAMNGHPLGCT